MGEMITEIAIAALIVGLALTVVHLLAVWGNGGLSWLSKPPMSYVVGMTVLGVPYVALLLWWGERQPAGAFVVITIVGGTPVIAGHVAKKFRILQKENEILRGELKNEHRSG